MADIGANGSVVNFGTADVIEARSITYSDSAAEIDGTVLNDAVHKVVAGASEIEVSIEAVGTGVAPVVGDIGALAVTWNDGGEDFVDGDWICISRETSAALDSEITVSLTFKPAAAIAS